MASNLRVMKSDRPSGLAIGRYWTPYDAVGRRWTPLDAVGRRWTLLDAVGRRRFTFLPAISRAGLNLGPR